MPEEPELNDKQRNLLNFLDEISEEALQFVGDFPVTIYGVLEDARPYGIFLAGFLTWQHKDVRHYELTINKAPDGTYYTDLNLDHLKNRKGLFVDDFYHSDNFFLIGEKLLDKPVGDSAYLWVFDRPAIKRYTQEEFEVIRTYLKGKEGLKD